MPASNYGTLDKVGFSLSNAGNTEGFSLWVHNMVVTPEPSTLVLLGMGALGLLAYAWRKRRRG